MRGEEVSSTFISTFIILFSFPGHFLASKSWSGLEQKLGATKVTGVVEGTIGIAAGYEKEPT